LEGDTVVAGVPLASLAACYFPAPSVDPTVALRIE
jgi:hypothetical protein